MGHSREEKERTHQRIVALAAKRLREEGLDGIGIADLMKEAGLTAGGFYKHFASRDDLVAEAIVPAAGTWDVAVEKARAEGTARSTVLADLIDGYLSTRHRDAPGAGCAFAALGQDLARSGSKVREVVTTRLAHDVDLIAGLYEGRSPRAARAEALLTISALIGAVSLARMADDPELSDEFLRSVKKTLKERSSP